MYELVKSSLLLTGLFMLVIGIIMILPEDLSGCVMELLQGL